MREAPGFHRLAEARLRGWFAATSASCGAAVPAAQPRAAVAETGGAPAPQRNAGRILKGCFQFLNEERRLGNPVDWRLAGSPDVPRLWRFHLHDHGFLLDLAAEGRGYPEFLDRVLAVALDWIDHNPLDDRDAMDAGGMP